MEEKTNGKEGQTEAERRETKVVTINCNNNFGHMDFIVEDDPELKLKAKILKDGRYFKLPEELKEMGREYGWIRWAGEKIIRGYKEELEKAIEEHDDIPFASKITSVEFDREIFLEYVQRAEKKKPEREEEKEKKEKEIFKKAKETGEKQKIKSYSIPCIDYREECDLDIVTLYAMPDGQLREEIRHTW